MSRRGPRYLAKLSGDKTYQLSTPCTRGHTGPRKTNNGQCIECENERKRTLYAQDSTAELERATAYREANRAKINEADRVRYHSDPERYRRETQIYYEKNRDSILAKNKTIHAERARDWAKKWYEENKDHVAKRAKRYREENPVKAAAMGAAGRARRRQAMPAWVDRNEIEAIYQRRLFLQNMTGVEMHVDHIVPLKGKGVCGLHVPWNLRVLQASLNQQKHARYGDDWGAAFLITGDVDNP